MTALRLYTDGSCYSPGTVGGSAWILVSEHPVASGSGKTPGPSNHQRCEVTAAIEGLTYLVASGIREVELLFRQPTRRRWDELHRLHRLQGLGAPGR
jgi:ribonuclease HI